MEQTVFSVFAQYGALGLFSLYFIYRDYTVGKEQNKLLSEIKSVLERQAAIEDAHLRTIEHERRRSEDCYESVVERLDRIDHKLDLCEKGCIKTARQ